MMTEEQIIARLLAVRLDRPPALPAPPPPKPAEVRAEERWREDNKPTKAVISDATAHTDALARRLRQEREEAEAEIVRARYQRELDLWWQSVRNVVDDGNVQIGGFRELRRPSCHCGPGDSDWRVR
jgi:hypothetical protein